MEPHNIEVAIVLKVVHTLFKVVAARFADLDQTGYNGCHGVDDAFGHGWLSFDFDSGAVAFGNKADGVSKLLGGSAQRFNSHGL